MRTKILIVLMSLAYAIFSEHLHLDKLDTFFSDFEQVVIAKPLEGSPSAWISISKLKQGKEEVPGSVFLDFINSIMRKKPRRVLLVLSEKEIQFSKSQQGEFVKILELNPNLMILTRWQNREEFSFLPKEQHLTFMTAIDLTTGGADGRIRRLVLSMDGKEYDSNFLKFTKFTDVSLPSLQNFPGMFNYYDSKQAHIRFYQNKSISEIFLKDNFEFSSDIEGKSLFVGSLDNFSVFNSTSIESRFTLDSSFTYQSLRSDAYVMLNIYENLRRGDYIHSLSIWNQSLWIFGFVLVGFMGLIYLRPSQFIFGSFALLGLSLVVSAALLFVFSYRLDVARIWMALFLMQYLGIPYLLIKITKKSGEEKVRQASEMAEERMRSRILVRAVAADASFKNVAQVSHDIRSPLMALQVAHRVIKDSISPEAGELIQGSIERLKYIAEDTLTKFRKGSAATSADSEFLLKSVVQDLVATFEKLYPDVSIKVEIPNGMKLLWPPHSLARSLTNLFNNSIEAYGAEKAGLQIQLSAESLPSRSRILIQDNGPGIPKNIQGQLFKAGATFGKKNGTGLGLYQVRKDLEEFGGHIKILQNTDGACFELTLPRYLNHIPMKISNKVVVVSSELHTPEFPSNTEVQVFSLVEEAKVFFASVQRLQDFTILIDLVFPGQQDTAFDLIESFQGSRPYKVIISTSLGENEDIRKMSDRYTALLVTPGLLSRFEFSTN